MWRSVVARMLVVAVPLHALAPELLAVARADSRGDADASSKADHNASVRLIRTHFPDGTVRRTELDALGRQTKRILPDGAEERFTYDVAGNRRTRVDFAGRATHYLYDASNRLQRRTYPDGSFHAFTYTATGRRASMVDARGTTSYAYDSRDRVTGLTYPDGRSLGFAYDLAGNRTGLTAFVDGQALATSFTYDALSRLDTVTDPAGGVYVHGYDENGNRASLVHPNGVATSYQHDNRNRLRELTAVHAVSGTVVSYVYTLAATGQRTRITEQDGTTRHYGYDLLSRLTDARRHLRLRQPRPPAERERGRPRLGRQRQPDQQDRPRRRHLHLGLREPPDYLVDPWHQTSAAGRTLVLSQVVAESDPTSATLTAYHVRGDDLLATLRPDPTSPGTWISRYFHAEGIGTIRALTDEEGQVTDRYSFEAFGTLLSHEGEDPNQYLFAGEPLDPNSGFYYNRARWLDPNAGRFASVDPFPGYGTEPLSIHRYLYSGLNPALFSDPSGEDFVGAITSLAISGLINASFAVLLGNNSISQPGFGWRLLSDFFWGAATAPLGGILSRLALRLIKPWTPSILSAIGSWNVIQISGTATRRMLVRFSRLFMNTNRNPPSIGSTWIGRQLKRFLPGFNWEMHHLNILQCFSRKGPNQLFTDVFENEGLRRLGNGLWNMAPIPRFLNNFISNSERWAPIFATIWYSTLFFGPWQTLQAVTGDGDEE